MSCCAVPLVHVNGKQCRPSACGALRPLPAARKQGDETPEVFRAVQEQIADALIGAAAALLSPAAQARTPGAARLPSACLRARCGTLQRGLRTTHAGLLWSGSAALGVCLKSSTAPILQGGLGFEGQHDEFGQTLCETMATLGSQHLGSLNTQGKLGPCRFGDTRVGMLGTAAQLHGLRTSNRRPLCCTRAPLSPPLRSHSPPHPTHPPLAEKRLAYLQHMLSFAQHPYMLLADKALPMWVKLLQDAATSAASAQSSAAAAAAAGGNLGSPRQVALPPECIAALMDVAAEQLRVRMRKGCCETAPALGFLHAVARVGEHSKLCKQQPGRQ